MIGYKALLLCAFVNLSQAFQIESVPLDQVLQILVPTTNSKNPKCRNHSVFYVEELKKLRLWATESRFSESVSSDNFCLAVFDASSKFPTGLLSGSTFDFGNFDECIEIQVPLTEEKIQGRYCMAKFHISPPGPKHEEKKYSKFYYGETIINASTWEKMIVSNSRFRFFQTKFT